MAAGNPQSRYLAYVTATWRTWHYVFQTIITRH